jgi:hypothetical protein
MKAEMLPAVIETAGKGDELPQLITQAGGGACFAWDEWFSAEIRNPHTRRAYGHAARQFLAWCEAHKLELRLITPGCVSASYDQLHVSIPTRKLHLAALRGFFDKLVVRHVVALNPAAAARVSATSSPRAGRPGSRSSRSGRCLRRSASRTSPACATGRSSPC